MRYKLKRCKRKKCKLKTDKWFQVISVGIACMGILFSLAGCGMQDSAVVIPVREENVCLESSSQEPILEGTTNLVYVYVCGAVVSPGVVELPEGSRASDALQAAGGFAEDAETSYVNLAAKVTDGERLYFPNVTEEMTFAEQEKEAGLVNINTADVKELCTLPGIGEARADSIIAYREANGLFGSKEDIMKVSGIKNSAYEKICDKITVK